ncbi:TIGR01457 family HAD-type hydrolase [Sporosarcina gallistercoris]|uniref:Acid sugar phosphatase n=1 Tax=Sporosarcina gallistercoris TaxID=2762245 RepID=A0ABR8PL11_9BACL|nr:TIGR01457 family HAD-type hydrolase [Sporosarcina gallistercoris]MBD7908856.1 TIGR01457 family HAD-type hydrolase [Sporosarcina gallistercoris]
MEHYKTICLDLDGTVYKGEQAIPESVDFIRTLQQSGIEPYFITNNSSRTVLEQQQKLKRLGVETSEHQIMTSAIASARYCAQNYTGMTVQMIGESGLREALLNEGITLVESDGDIVVMGIDHEITYEKLASACLSIRKGACFLATNGDLSLPNEIGLVPGNGAFIELVKASTGVAPTILGKPQSYMLEFVQQQTGAHKEEMLMIGDNYDTDILSGIRYGIDTIHLQCGVTSLEEVLGKLEAPTYMFKTLAEWNTTKGLV